MCVPSSPGEYSCLKAEFHLQRSLGYHMVQSYLPTVLIVVISWVSFWLDVDAIPARVTLGVTTLLTISSKASFLGRLPEDGRRRRREKFDVVCSRWAEVGLVARLPGLTFLSSVSVVTGRRYSVQPPTSVLREGNGCLDGYLHLVRVHSSLGVHSRQLSVASQRWPSLHCIASCKCASLQI